MVTSTSEPKRGALILENNSKGIPGDLWFSKTVSAVKRGGIVKFDVNSGLLRFQDLLFSSSSTHKPKSGGNAHSRRRGSRLRQWLLKGLALAIICFLCVIGVGFFIFVHWHGLFLAKKLSSDRSGITSFRSARFKLVSNQLEAKVVAWEKRLKNFVESDGVRKCNPYSALLKVFMYDLPSEFHFGLIEDFQSSPDAGNVWPRNLSNLPRYPGGLNKQHSVEYWLTADILTSDQPDRKEMCTAVRVQTPEEADVAFVPFFASLSWRKYAERHKNGHDHNGELQLRLVKFLEKQRPWLESGGTDHVLVTHHPNALAQVRHKLRSSVFIVNDFGRFHDNVANREKDIVAPYNHVIPSFSNDSTTFESRTILLFFQGTIARKKDGVIRRRMYDLLRDKDGVRFMSGNTQSDGIRSATVGMRNSKYCLHLAGDTPSSGRFFDAIASHCVPVVISDKMEFPFAEALDYSEFCIVVRAKDALKKDFVMELLRNISRDEWTRMWLRLREIAHHFEFQHPALPMDAVHMLWRAIAKRALLMS